MKKEKGKRGRGEKEKRGKGKTVMSDSAKKKITRHTELEVYQKAFAVAMKIFQISKSFPAEERYSLTDQIRRSSRSVCANLAEAWRKRHYEAHWASKLTDSEAEAAEPQTWIQFTVECKYIDRETGADIYKEYESILGMLVSMRTHPDDWCFA